MPPLKTRKIAFVLPGFEIGGAEHVVSILASTLAVRNWYVDLISFAEPQTPLYFKVDARVNIHKIGTCTARRGLKLVLHRVIVLRQALRKLQPDILITFLTRTNILSQIASCGSGIPVIVSERSNPDAQKVRFAWQYLRLFFYRQAFTVVTPTSGALAYFPDTIRRRGKVIENPVQLPENWQARRGAKILTAVGRLVYAKGFDLLLQAFSIVATHDKDWTLTIWGEGEERQSLTRMIDNLGLGNRVNMPGTSETAGLWIETADVLVLPSRYEGYPNVILEAMAAGIPVVSYDCKWGPSDIIESGVSGILVEPENVFALANALSKVLSDPGLRERFSTAGRTVAQRFSQDKITAKWEQLLNDALH